MSSSLSSRTAATLFVTACLSLPAGCGSSTTGNPASPGIKVVAPVPTNPAAASRPAASPIQFRDVSPETGIRFTHCSGIDKFKYYPTSLGSGVAMLDFDGDGRLDLYFCSTRNLPLSEPNRSGGNRLYRNVGGMRFEDVTDRAGVGFKGFCHGAAVGDFDNDGDPDLFLTNLGSNLLYRNNGNGAFDDVTSASNLAGPEWSSGAAFLDYDCDGKLDLYVTCYGVWDRAMQEKFCGDRDRNLRIFCSPFDFVPARHHLYRGHGDGTFEEVTEKAGVARDDGRGLGVVAADVNGDALTDLYVANDGCPNFLFLNKGDGTFEDVTETSGAATDESGQVQGSMGVDVQDVDGDGRPELFVTNFRGQYNTLYRNIDGRSFQDVSGAAGIVKDSRPLVGWGCALADFDNDGKPDMMVVNGELDDNMALFGFDISYEQPALLYRNQGGLRFERTTEAGLFFTEKHVARGAAFGDLDNDGDLDAVVLRLDATPVVLANESTGGGRWIRFELEGRRCNRSAIGAAVIVHAGGRLFHRIRRGGDSYLSANDPRLLVGLGKVDRVDRVEILWPGGGRSELTEPEIGRTHKVVEPDEPPPIRKAAAAGGAS